MTFEEALLQLCRTRTLSTDLLEPLGINFEAFLALGQMPKDMRNRIIERLIVKLTEASPALESRLVGKMSPDEMNKAHDFLSLYPK